MSSILNPLSYCFLLLLLLQQISDWLTLNREMLKQQSIPVGDIDTIATSIDKQKVSAYYLSTRFVLNIVETRTPLGV